jgi:hypothetical protein
VEHGVERRCPSAAELVRVDDLLELGVRLACGRHVTGGESDLGARRETANARERVARLAQRARDRGGGRVDLPLREPEQRQPRLWIASELVGSSIRLLGRPVVAEPPANLTDLVVPAGGDRALEVVQLLARLDRLTLRADEVASEAHDLRAVDAARAGEAAHVELVAPLVRDVRPLRRASVVADVLARRDRQAVDEAARVRADVADDGPRRALVHEREPRFHFAALHPRAPAADEREHLRIAIAETPPELFGCRERLDCLVEAAAEQPFHALREPDHAVERGLGLVLEQPLCVREPALGDRERAAPGVVPRQRQRDPRRPQLLPGSREAGERTLAQLDRLVQSTPPPRSVAEPLEVVGGQLRAVERRVRVVRLAPGLA